MILADRFWSKVDRSGGPDACWPWVAARDPQGYGRFKSDGSMRIATRVALALVGRALPDGVNALHSCDNPPCCNPQHLFPGSVADNNRDMAAKKRNVQQRKKHCPRGHELIDGNLVASQLQRGWRSCLTCQRAAHKRWQAANRGAPCQA